MSAAPTLAAPVSAELHRAAGSGYDLAQVLASSELEPYTLADLLALADDETRALWDSLTLDYPSVRGHGLLRAEIASLYDTAAADDVLVSAGADRAIAVAVAALVRPGDRVVLVRPVYGPLVDIAAAAGADVRFVSLRAEEGWRLDLDRLEVALGRRPRLAILNFPHNPTGYLPDTDLFAAAVRLAESRGARVLSDEVYRGLERDPRDRLPSAVDLSERAIAVGVLSKAFAAPGLRIGWLASRDRKLLDRAASGFGLGASAAATSELLALAALRARDEVLARSRAIVARNLEAVAALVARRGDTLDWVPPRAGSVCFPRLGASLSVDILAAALHARGHGALLTSRMFQDDGNHFRVGLGRLATPAALHALEEVLP